MPHEGLQEGTISEWDENKIQNRHFFLAVKH